MAILAAVLSHFESNSQNPKKIPKKFQKNSKKIQLLAKKFKNGSKTPKLALNPDAMQN